MIHISLFHPCHWDCWSLSHPRQVFHNEPSLYFDFIDVWLSVTQQTHILFCKVIQRFSHGVSLIFLTLDHNRVSVTSVWGRVAILLGTSINTSPTVFSRTSLCLWPCLSSYNLTVSLEVVQNFLFAQPLKWVGSAITFSLYSSNELLLCWQAVNPLADLDNGQWDWSNRRERLFG